MAAYITYVLDLQFTKYDQIMRTASHGEQYKTSMAMMATGLSQILETRNMTILQLFKAIAVKYGSAMYLICL